MCVGASGGRLKSTNGRGGGGAILGIPQVEEDSAGNWRREFVFFRNLVAWFSYLSQYIFTYLLLKMNTITINEKESCKYVVNIYKEDPLSCRCSHWRTCSVE